MSVMGIGTLIAPDEAARTINPGRPDSPVCNDYCDPKIARCSPSTRLAEPIEETLARITWYFDAPIPCLTNLMLGASASPAFSPDP
jgi:hypothetical protein